MAKKEVEICDICKKRISDLKCELCNLDVCEECRGFFGIGSEERLIINVLCCTTCADILQDIDLEKGFKDTKFKEEFVENLRQLIQLEELEGNIKPKRTLIPIVIPTVFPTPSPTNYGAIYPFSKKDRTRLKQKYFQNKK